MTNRFSRLIYRAKDIYQEEGLLALIKRVFARVLTFEYRVYHVYVKILEEENEADYLPNLENATHRIIETTQQLDELYTEGFDLSLLNINKCRHRLARGAILSLIFVDREFASESWAACTEEAKNTIDPYPYEVDFTNYEVCGGGTRVNPKYRRQGLHYYTLYKKEQFLIQKGAIKDVYSVLASNTISQRTSAGRGSELVARTRYIEMFGFRLFRERSVKSKSDNAGRP